MSVRRCNNLRIEELLCPSHPELLREASGTE